MPFLKDWNNNSSNSRSHCFGGTAVFIAKTLPRFEGILLQFSAYFCDYHFQSTITSTSTFTGAEGALTQASVSF